MSRAYPKIILLRVLVNMENIFGTISIVQIWLRMICDFHD